MNFEPRMYPVAPVPADGGVRFGHRRARRVLVGAGALALAGAVGWTTRPSEPRRWPALTYPLINGGRFAPEQALGRAAIVHFWATTCGICLTEWPEWLALYQTWQPRGLQVLAIALPTDRPDRVLAVTQQLGAPFAVALDPMGAAAAAWGGVSVVPSNWLMAPDGRVVRTWQGRLLRHKLEPELAQLCA